MLAIKRNIEWTIFLEKFFKERLDLPNNEFVVEAIKNFDPSIYEELKEHIDTCLADPDKIEDLLVKLGKRLGPLEWETETFYFDRLSLRTIDNFRKYARFNARLLEGRQWIWDFIKKKSIPAYDVYVTGSYVLFLNGIRKYFNDIDLILPTKYIPLFEFDIDKRLDDVVLLGGGISPRYLFDKVEIVFDDVDENDFTKDQSLNVASLDYILRWKKYLNREKDQEDIKNIEQAIADLKFQYSAFRVLR